MQDLASKLGTETTVASQLTPTVVIPLPKQLGSIRLIRQIGKGGMAEVWLAKHEILGRDVAIKLLSTTVMRQGDASWSEFIESARVAAARTHPGLNKVFHADIAEGVPYLVLEYLDGPNLQELLAKSGRLDLPSARTVIESVCGAVTELHQHDLVHRDLKPSNIMLTTDGQVVVTDFGLARAGVASALRASGGGVAGTPAYMAPEMFDGVVSARTDVYAIGMTAYHLLTGQPAFSGSFDELKQQHQTATVDLEPLRAVRVPATVIDVIVRATSKDVLFRPKSARLVLEAFRAAFETAAVPCATPVQITALITRRPLSSPTQTEPAPSSTSGIWHERLASLAGRRRNRKPKPEPQREILPMPALPNDADFLLRKSAERRRTRIAGIIAMFVGAIVGVWALFYGGRVLAGWEQWVDGHLAPAKTVGSNASIWTSLMYGIPPLVLLTVASSGMSFLIYSLLRGRRLPEGGGKTKCGWCEHELRGIPVPVCAECGHRIGDQGPDEQREKPLGLQWGYRLRVLLLLQMTFFAIWVGVPIFAALILSLVIRASSVLGVGIFFIAFLAALAITLRSYEEAARYQLSRSGLAWCRRCRGELRGLSEPVCPTCGERI